MKTDLSTATPNLKSLQMALQGSLLLRKRVGKYFFLLFAEVNAGPLEICRVFLGDNMTKYNKQHVEKLVAAMNDFIRTLGRQQ